MSLRYFIGTVWPPFSETNVNGQLRALRLKENTAVRTEEMGVAGERAELISPKARTCSYEFSLVRTFQTVRESEDKCGFRFGIDLTGIQCLTDWHKERWKNRNKTLFSAICTKPLWNSSCPNSFGVQVRKVVKRYVTVATKERYYDDAHKPHIGAKR